MRVLHWCMIGVTLLLLLCEVVVSQVCKSLITLVDGFHTLYLLMQMLSFSLQSPSVKLSSWGFPASSPPAPSSSSSSSSHSFESSPKPPQSSPQPSTAPPAAPHCGLSYTHSRIRPLGALIAPLVLVCLNISCLIEIINYVLEPRPGQEPLLLVVTGAVSLFLKMLLLLGLRCSRLLGDRVRTEDTKETESHIEVNHRAPTVLAEGETRGLEEGGGVLDSTGEVRPAVDDSVFNGALVLCNPDSLKLHDSESPAPMRLDGEASLDLNICRREAHSGDVAEIHKDSTSIDNENSSSPPPGYTSSHQSNSLIPISQQPACLIPFTLNIQDLSTTILVLINSMVMLVTGSTCSGPCSSLSYLDPMLSVLAVIILTAKALPEVLRYGMLMLQSTPPHISVSDLGLKIAGVPGVQAIHDLHIWQLTDSLIVASVHIHCHAGFPVYRCADVLLGVTRVLQSVGVSCCTVQPEFTSCSAPSAADQADGARDTPSTTPLPICSLTCGKACAGCMCCAVLEDGCRGLSAPPAGETKKEHQTLIIENSVH